MSDRVATGIPGLDKMLHGGMLPARNVLLAGPCGSGKSTLAAQFLHAGCERGEVSLYVTLEESKKKLYADLLQFGFDFTALEQQGKFLMIGGPLATLTRHMERVDAKTKHLIVEIEKVIAEHQVKRVVIDSINLFTMLEQDEGRMRMALALLCNTLSSSKVTALLLGETKEGSFKLSTHGIEEFIVDGVVALYHVRQGERFIPGITVRKMRGTNHDRDIRLFKITDKGVVVYPEETLFTDV